MLCAQGVVPDDPHDFLNVSSFSIAAGFAMLVSTLIAWPFQKYLGSYPFLIFIILTHFISI